MHFYRKFICTKDLQVSERANREAMAARRVETEKIDKLTSGPVEPRKLHEAIEFARKKLGVDKLKPEQV